VGRGAAALASGGRPAELLGMTSSASSATWLPAVMARAAVLTAPPARDVPAPGRHRASEAAGLVEAVTTSEDAALTGRHAEQEWTREVFDPQREDVDAFEWLGFAPARY
jgi:hypothetical protein